MKITYVMILIVVLVFGLQLAGILDNSHAFMPAAITSRPYSIVTSIFMHGSAQHLLLNLLGLFIFGLLVEERIGWKKWILVYFTAGFTGNLGYLLLTNSPFVPALGASGAIFGLMGAAAVLMPRQIIFTQFGPIPMWFAAIVWGGIEVMSMFKIDNIAHSAHLFGLIGGFIIAYSHKKNTRDYIYPVILFLPVVLIIFFATSMPTEIRGFENPVENCNLLSKVEQIGFKYYLYDCNGDLILGLTKSSVGTPNPAYYNNYFPEILSDLLGGNCEIEMNLDIEQNKVIANGEICEFNFLAIAQNCDKERFELIQIYDSEPLIQQPSCNLLR